MDYSGDKVRYNEEATEPHVFFSTDFWSSFFSLDQSESYVEAQPQDQTVRCNFNFASVKGFVIATPNPSKYVGP